MTRHRTTHKREGSRRRTEVVVTIEAGLKDKHERALDVTPQFSGGTEKINKSHLFYITEINKLEIIPIIKKIDINPIKKKRRPKSSTFYFFFSDFNFSSYEFGSDDAYEKFHPHLI